MDAPAWFILLLLYLSVAWLVFLGGVAASQSSCSGTISFDTQGNVTSGGDQEATLNFDSTFGSYSCTNAYGLSWWVCFYQLIVILITLGCTVKDQLSAHRVALVGILAPLTAILMEQANAFLKLSDQVNSSETNTAAAGAILLSMGNPVLIYYIGLQEPGVVMAKEFFPGRSSSA